MITLSPGGRLGKTQNPPLAMSLGWYRIGTALAPVAQVVGRQPKGVTSTEGDRTLESVEISEVVGREGVYLIEGVLKWDVIGSLPKDIVGQIPEGLVSEEFIDEIPSLEPPDVESEEP